MARAVSGMMRWLDVVNQSKDVQMSPNRKLGILHISDLHESADRERETWRRRRVLGDAWIENLRVIRKEVKIDLVCFTGDAADWGRAEEFETATEFFELTLAELDLDWSRFFLVPGNHDIHRGTHQNTWRKLRAELASCPPLEISRWIDGSRRGTLSQETLAQILDRQTNYRAWLRNIDRSELLPSVHPHLGYRVAISLPDQGTAMRVHLIGLDSSWLCGDDNDAEKLRLSDTQIGRLCTSEEGDKLDGFRVALVHHPLDHLYDAEDARRYLGEHVDLLLRGHRHQPNLSLWSDEEQRLRELAAGCLYEVDQADQYPNACTVIEVELDPRSHPVRYHVWFRAWSRKGHWYDDDSQYSGTRSGRITVGDRRHEAVESGSWCLPYKLPDNYVSRGKDEEQLNAQLCPGRTIVLWGTGGFGKTTLAIAACQAHDLQSTFPDGIFWITLGEEPSSPLPQLQDFLFRLTGRRSLYSTQDAIITDLVEALEGKKALIVIDDVWHKAKLEPFLQRGLSCSYLITTRDRSLAPAAAHVIEISALSDSESRSLLTGGLPPGAPDAHIERLTSRLGNWPLLLNLVNRALHESMLQEQSLSEAMKWADDLLDEIGLTAFDARQPIERNEALNKTLNLSFALLSEEELRRYSEVAIFPAEQEVPLPILRALWSATAAWKEVQSERLYRLLRRIALLEDLRFDRGTLRLHTVLRQYLIERLGTELPSLHEKFLDHIAPEGREWHSLAPDELYIWDNLAYHLLAARRPSELERALLDPWFLASKSFHRSTFNVEADFRALRIHLSESYNLEALENAFIAAAHLFHCTRSPSDGAAMLHSRMPHLLRFPGAEGRADGPMLKPWIDLPDLALTRGGSRTIQNRGSAVECACLDPSGRAIFSGSWDGIMRKWEIATGRLQLEFGSHETAIRDCAITPDGRCVVSREHGGLVCVWDANQGDLLRSWQTEEGIQASCVIEPSGRFLFTFGNGKKLRKWMLDSGKEVPHSLENIEPFGSFCMSRDGTVAAASFRNKSMRLWNSETGKQILVLAGLFPISTIDVNPDHTRLLVTQLGQNLYLIDIRTAQVLWRGEVDFHSRSSFGPAGKFFSFAGRNHSVAVASSESGEIIKEFQGHSSSVQSAAVSPKNDFVISISSDRTIRVYSLSAPAADCNSRSAYSCEVGWDGKAAASGTADGHLMLWNLQNPEQQPREIHLSSKAVVDCALSAELVETSILVAGTADGLMFALSVKGDGIRFLERAERADGDSKYDGGVACCCLSSDLRLAAFGTKKHLEVWDIVSHKRLHMLKGHTSNLSDCVFLPARPILVSCAWDQTIRIWSLVSGEPLAVLMGHSHGVTSVNVSPDGSLIVSTSRDGTIRLWSTSKWSPDAVFVSDDDELSDANFSPDGNLLAVTSATGFLAIWSIEQGSAVTTLPVAGPLFRCSWLPDGKRIVAAGQRGMYFLKLV